MASKKYNEKGRVVLNKQIADGIFQLSAVAPQIAEAAQPGQFVHICVAEHADQFLRMPFAVYDVSTVHGAVDIVYQVVGEGTRQLTQVRAGEYIDLIGPIGNGWSPPADTKHALVVGGGVGTPAISLLAAKLAGMGARVDAVIGAMNKDKLSCVDHIGVSTAQSGGEVWVTTDDGSYGTHGFVTAITDDAIASGDYDYVAVCGPTPMMCNTVKPALKAGITCEVSMEKLMACGVGACLSCVLDTTKGRKRCCVDGPVFDAVEVIW